MPQDIQAHPEEQRGTLAYSSSERKSTLKTFTAGSSGEAVAGGAAVILAILGLVGVLPVYMVAIATICAGGAMFLEGSAVASKFKDLEEQLIETKKTEVAIGGGMAFEVLGGIAGVVLGILALVGVASGVLVSVAAIAMGGALLLGAGATERLDKVQTYWRGASHHRSKWLHDTVLGAAGLQVLAGLAAVTLGILALSGVVPLILDLVAMLAIGGAVLLAGAAMAGEMGAALRS
jgi:hypothetical protein